MTNYSIKNLKKSTLQEQIVTHALLYRFSRHISLRMTWFFLKIKGITPTQVTLLGMITGIIAALFFATGDYHYGVVGAFLVYLSYLLDCCDGEIARAQKSYSLMGHYMDALTGHLVGQLFLFGIVFGTFIRTQNYLILVLGFLMLFSHALYDILVNMRYAIYNYYSRSKKKDLKLVNVDKKTKSNIKSPNFLVKFVLFFSKFIFIFQLYFRYELIILLGILGKLDYFIYFYGIIHPLFLIANIIYQYYGGLWDFFDRTDFYLTTGQISSFNS